MNSQISGKVLLGMFVIGALSLTVWATDFWDDKPIKANKLTIKASLKLARMGSEGKLDL